MTKFVFYISSYFKFEGSGFILKVQGLIGYEYSKKQAQILVRSLNIDVANNATF